MDEALKQAVLDLIAYIKQGAAFVETQAPLIAQEYLRYWAIASCIYIGIGLVVTGIAFACWLKGRRWAPDDWRDNDGICPWYIAAVVGGWAGPTITIYWILELIRIQVAPRLYVLQGLKSLL
jgi:hypothetical protein